MKRLLLLVMAASVVSTVTVQNTAHATALPPAQGAVQCAPRCATDSYAVGVSASEPQPPLHATPAERSTFSLAFFLVHDDGGAWRCSLVCSSPRATALEHSSRSTSLQEWAIQAAFARKRKHGGGTQPAAHSQREPKAITSKRSANAPVASRTSDCYWSYQARQLG